ncbi:MAG TPA: sensor histidine kinase [Bacillales bacterium]|nr:sensor histidine kinase [Bacillales bacterium]
MTAFYNENSGWMLRWLVTSLYAGAILFLVFQLWVLLHPEDQNAGLCFTMSLTGFAVTFAFGFIRSFQERRALRKRLRDLSAHIVVLSRGNLSRRIKDDGGDEIALIARELNEWADKMQKQVDSLQKLANEKAVLAEKASAAAAIEERQRLARDLHDAVSQQLFAVNMLASAAVKRIDSDKEAAKQQMKEAAETAAKAQGEMRALLLHLRPVHLSGDSLVEAVKKLAGELEGRSGMVFELDAQNLGELPKGIEDHLFRVIQEGLANILRHSRADTVKLRLHRGERHVHLHLRDDGKGFDVANEKKTSYGLRTMQERCDEIGAALTITSRKDAGTIVDVKVPLRMEGINEDGEN